MIETKPDRGTKRTCQSCAVRYYDLGSEMPACPKCGAKFVEAARAYPVHKSRRRPVAVVPKPAPEEHEGPPVVELVEPDDDEADGEETDEDKAEDEKADTEEPVE